MRQIFRSKEGSSEAGQDNPDLCSSPSPERGYDACPPGAVAEWLGRGLQSLVHRFESGPRLSESVYRWIEHTGELELAIDAPAEPVVFADAFAAFVELVRDDGDPGDGGQQMEIELRGEERDALLADWLDELVYLADAQQFVPDQLVDLWLEGDRLRATLRGHRGEPCALVKAVTRHRLAFEPDGSGGWHARVVLDV